MTQWLFNNLVSKVFPKQNFTYEKSFRKCTIILTLYIGRYDDVYNNNNNNNNFVHKYFSVNALVAQRCKRILNMALTLAAA